MSISLTWRQILVAGSPQLAALSVGGVVGYPGVLMHQLRANDSMIELDLNMSSWIGSLHGLAGIPSILMPAVMQWKGRKFAFIATCTIIIIGWILAYTATNTTTILLSESFHGFGTNSILSVSLLSMGEMITPEYRNIFLLSFSIIQSLGMSMVGLMASYLHWKTISVIMCVPISLALFAACLWPESPSWLACKGEFEKCERSFTWLRGTDDISKKELEELINAQKEILSSDRSIKRNALDSFWNTVTSRDFYIPGIHMFVLLNLMYWSGIMVILIYSIEIIEKVTSNPNAASIGGLIINSTLFVGYTITGILIRRFANKTVLLISALGTSVCLLITCLTSYLQGTGFLAKDSLVCLYFLVAYMVCSSLGVNSIVFTVAAELMPVKHRGLGGPLYVVYTCILHTSSLKLSPYLFLYLSMPGTFLIYTINAILCSLFIWKYVPETKGKTLQEIEYFYMHGKFVHTVNKDREQVKLFNVK